MTQTAMVASSNGQATVPQISWRTATLKKASILDSFNVPAQLGGRRNWTIDSKGFIAGVRLHFGGTATITSADAGAKADWPWSIINRVRFSDSGAGTSKNLKGYSAYLASKYFQPYVGRDLGNPRASGGSVDARVYAASVATPGTQQMRFTTDLPIQCHDKDGLGLLPNQNASFVYTLDVDFEAPANLFTTPGNFAGALVVQPEYDYRTVPSPVRGDGAQVAVLPPFIGVVRRVFDETMLVPSAAENRYKITTGNVCRNFIVVTRNASGDRVNGLTRAKLFYGDDTAMFEFSEQMLVAKVHQEYGEPPETGVYPFTFTNDSDFGPGNDFNRDLLDTRNLAQLYFNLTTAAGVTTIDVIHDELIVNPNTVLAR